MACEQEEERRLSFSPGDEQKSRNSSGFWKGFMGSLRKGKEMGQDLDKEEIHTWDSDLKLAWWGNGEWVEEPDLVLWKYKGVECRIRRTAHVPEADKITQDELKSFLIFGGHLCGYISIPLDHPWVDKETEIDCDVHGGCTWNSVEKDGKRWVGFDCAHSGDITPSMIATNKKMKEDLMIRHPSLITEYSPIFRESYKNNSFCIKECESLVDQMLEAYENS